jgi:uncharacterized membrane protein
MSTTSTKLPVWFWVVSVLALLWNLAGVAAYLMQAYMTDEVKAALSPEDQAMYDNLPSWYVAVFALAVFCGALGCIALILRKKWANVLLPISMVCVIAQMSYVAFVLEMANVITAMTIIISIGLVWFARKSQQSGWIK